LDDYHLIEGAPIHHTLGVLLERGPPQLRLVLASRADPPLPLARLRARGQLAELRERDLRFTPQETTALLEEAMGLDLPAASLAALAARTEGWVAGLQLAALSLQGHTDPAGFVASFSGSHQYVLDYLTEEVLARRSEDLVGFLLETSVLERLSGELCDAVTGRSDSQHVLGQIERANLFLVPLDEVRGWWRYHQLFADLLRARLHQQQPDRVPELHRAAAAWCQQHGLADEAVRHAVAAGDPDWAARLIEQHVEALYRRSEAATMQRWYAALPAELVRSRPRLHLRITGDRSTGRLLGAQVVGDHRAQVAKRIDISAIALFHRMTLEVLGDLDLSHTPPFGSPWDAAQMAAQAWVRQVRGGQPRDPPVSTPAPERRVLFVCTHNTGRSIVAAALLNARKPLASQPTRPALTRPTP
jgi:hypothetical protein